MSRSKWKFNFIDLEVLRLISTVEQKGKKKFKIKSRRSLISEQFLGYECLIYNGYSFKKVSVKELMFNHKYGEFSFSRSFPEHKKK